MQQTPFHAFYTARVLESMTDDERLLPVFASSDIKIYPFQIAAANFALRSPYQKGVIFCDEAGMGKSHEAMLVIVQKWYEGRTRILIAIPNADLLCQWVEMIKERYTVPYIVLKNREDWNEHISDDNPNAFEQEAVIVTTYDFLSDNAAAMAVHWDLTVFEEASALSSVYEETNKQAKALKAVAGDSFKLLLTGTPIEKNIMDLYGLICFIDETILPEAQEFLQRYFRKPENYPELAERVSKYCFRTLRSQAKQYAKIPDRKLITYEYNLSQKEQELYNLLYAYINKPNKKAFPQMDVYELAVNSFFHQQGSSTTAILQTIKGVIKRLERMENIDDELNEFRQMEALAENISTDQKSKLLLSALDKIFKTLKQLGAKKKVLIFTHSVQTQKYLYGLLNPKYKTVLYGGGNTDGYEAIKAFKTDTEILISTDHGSRGFNLEETACIVHYDLLFNTLKMEQRIDRSHRLGQENDVISIVFFDKNNMADVRKLELVNKRTLVADGVFGVTDDVIGGFTDNIEKALSEMNARTREQVEADYLQTLTHYEAENKQIVTYAEDILFTTFTRELADKVRITPRYIEDKTKEINADIWAVVKWFFEQRNKECNDGHFAIDDVAQTVTAQDFEKLPTLFYYWTGSRNKPYTSLKSYGMAKDLKQHNRITLSSIIGRGTIHQIECSDTGTLVVDADIDPCVIGLYSVTVSAGKNGVLREFPILIGKTNIGTILSHDECRAIMEMLVVSYTDGEHKSAHWLKGTSNRTNDLDYLVPLDELLQKQKTDLAPAQAEEIERIKLRAAGGKSAIDHAINDMQGQIKTSEQELATVTYDRMKTLAIEKKISKLRQELIRKQENQFFEAMQLDLDVESKVNEFLSREKLQGKVVRQFVIEVSGKITEGK